MKLFSKPAILAMAAMTVLWMIGAGWTNRAAGQARPGAPAATGVPTVKGKTAGEYFKNVTTATLKALTPSDFLGAMGVMTAAVGYDCSNCHPGAGTDTRTGSRTRTPRKSPRARWSTWSRRINKTFFGGAQMVTCWTCHHGLDLPTTSIALDKLYGEPPDEKRDIVVTQDGEPPANRDFRPIYSGHGWRAEGGRL